MKNNLAAIFRLTLALLLLAAPGTGGAKAQGVLEIRLKDHREAIGDFSKLILTIDKIAVSPKVGVRFWQAGWRNLEPAINSVDLTKYIGGNSARLFRGAIEAGAFDAVDLKLKGLEGIVKKDQRHVPIKNLMGPVKLTFEVQPAGETLVVLDLVVLDMSDHPPRGYELGVKGYELYTNGKLVDKIPPGS